MNCLARYLLLTGFAVTIVKCAAQQQTQPDRAAAKISSEVIFVQPLTQGSNKPDPNFEFNLLSLKGTTNWMSYDARIGSATGMVPLRFDYSAPNSSRRIDARHWRLGIEQAERINLMQMKDYRWRNATMPSSSTLQPSVTERMFNTP